MSEEKWYLTLNYQETKDIIRENLESMSRSFIATGYYLRLVQSSEGYREDGYKDIWEFAEDQYGIKRSTTSRRMSMNEKFSEGGNSPVLAEEFREYSKSQLQEILYLPENKLDEVHPDMTVKDIREIRKPVQPKENPEKHGCVTGWSRYPDFCSCCGYDGTECCKDCTQSCNSRCGWINQPYIPEGKEVCATSHTEEKVEFPAGSPNQTQELDTDPDRRKAVDNICETPYDDDVTCVDEGRSISSLVLEYCENSKKLNELICICQENDTNLIRAKKVQECIGYSGGENSEITYDFRGYANGIVFQSDGQKTVLSYIQFVRAMEEIYGPWNAKDNKPSDAPPVTDATETNAEVQTAAESEAEKATSDKGMKYQVRQCLSNLSVEVHADAWSAALATLNHMEHYIKQVSREKDESQPELPVLKNDDQRKEWLRNYKEWGLWYEDKNIGVKYYRYIFDDGTQLIAEEYPKSSFDYTSYLHIVGGPKERKCYKYSYHEKYTRYPDSEAGIIEYLKHIQKGDKAKC